LERSEKAVIIYIFGLNTLLKPFTNPPMKKAILSLLFIFSILQLKAQSLEVSVQAGTGVSHYVGAGTVSSTVLNINGQQHTGYPNGDGNRNATIFSGDIQLQYAFKCNFILGLQMGYEALGSKVDITGISTNPLTPATGSFTDRLNYINLNPFVGYRFNLKNVSLDVMPGLDFAIGTSGKQTGKAIADDNVVYNSSSLNGKPDADVRAKLGLAAYYKKFGITASYSHGFVDFNSGLLADGPVPSMRIEIFRLGLSYRIK
jgi:hypothetical protein